MADNESKYNFVLTAQDRASEVFERMHGKLDIFELGMHSLEGSLMSATSGLSGFGMVAASATVTVGGIAAGILEAAKSTAEYEDHLAHLSQKLGVTTEFLSKMQYAAKMEDIDPERLEKSLQKLEIGIGQATSGLSATGGTAKKAFDELGVSITNADGSAKTSESIMLDLADAFGKQTDSSKKAALAAAIFGRRSIDLIQILNQGRGALQQYFDEAENHGLVVTQESAEKAKKFEENLKSLGATLQGLKITIGNDAIPAMDDMASGLDKLIKKARDLSFTDFFKYAAREALVPILQPSISNPNNLTEEQLAALGGNVAPQIGDGGPDVTGHGKADEADNKASDALMGYIMQDAPKEEQELYKVAEEAQKVADALVKAGEDPQPAWDEMNKRLEAVHNTFDNMQKSADLSFEDYNSLLKKIVGLTGEGADELAKSNKEMELVNYGKVLDEMKDAGMENSDLWKTVGEQYDAANTEYQQGIYTLHDLKNAQEDVGQAASDMADKTVDAAHRMQASMSSALAVMGSNAGNPIIGYGPSEAQALFGSTGSTLFDTSAQLFESAPMPAMGKGGIVTRPTRALVGEAGPEAIIPLGKGMGTGIGGGVNISGTVININGYNKDAKQLAREIDGELAALTKGGRSQLAVELQRG